MKILLKILFLCLGILLFTFNQVRASVLLDKSRNDYQYQLDEYRNEYEEFDIKRIQYNNVNTFAAQEEMTTAVKVVLLRRVGVWRAYVQMLRVELLESKGIDLEEKDKLVQNLEDWKNKLDQHSQRLSSFDTRGELLTESRYLNNAASKLLIDTYVSLAHIKLALVQHILDSQRALAGQLKEQVQIQIRDSEVRDARLRGFEQLNDFHNQAQADISSVQIQVERLKSSTSNPLNLYEDIVAKLAPIYQELKQSFSILKELAKGIL